MFRRPNFSHSPPAREWFLILAGGVCLGLLLAWLQKRFQLDPRVVRLVLLVVGGVVFLWFVLILCVYVKELRREEDEWAGRDEEDDTN